MRGAKTNETELAQTINFDALQSLKETSRSWNLASNHRLHAFVHARHLAQLVEIGPAVDVHEVHIDVRTLKARRNAVLRVGLKMERAPSSRRRERRSEAVLEPFPGLLRCVAQLQSMARRQFTNVLEDARAVGARPDWPVAGVAGALRGVCRPEAVFLNTVWPLRCLLASAVPSFFAGDRHGPDRLPAQPAGVPPHRGGRRVRREALSVPGTVRRVTPFAASACVAAEAMPTRGTVHPVMLAASPRALDGRAFPHG